MSYSFDGDNYNITVKNKSNVTITLSSIFVHTYSNKFGNKVLNQSQNPIIDNSSGEDAPYRLDPVAIKIESFEAYKPENNSGKKKN